jgi:ribosomal protein S27E
MHSDAVTQSMYSCNQYLREPSSFAIYSLEVACITCGVAVTPLLARVLWRFGRLENAITATKGLYQFHDLSISYISGPKHIHVVPKPPTFAVNCAICAMPLYPSTGDAYFSLSAPVK